MFLQVETNALSFLSFPKLCDSYLYKIFFILEDKVPL